MKRLHPPAVAGVLAALAVLVGIEGARADVRLRAQYAATLGGIPIGKGSWLIDFASTHYNGEAEGGASGILRAIASGNGKASAGGSVVQGRLQPASYAIAVATESPFQVRMRFSGASVKDLSIDPPMEPNPERVPVTEAHRRGVLDPLTAAIVPVAGTGNTLTPEACRRTVPIFDGTNRIDIAMSFKRMDQVKAEKGYQGPVVVCTMLYRPIAGHRPSRFAIQYLMEQRDMEVSLAPVAGTRMLVPFRISIPTLLGRAVLQATEFETSGTPLPSSKLRPS